MSQTYCVTVEDVYGKPLAELKAPQDWCVSNTPNFGCPLELAKVLFQDETPTIVALRIKYATCISHNSM
jgi:hypothetical protein